MTAISSTVLHAVVGSYWIDPARSTIQFTTRHLYGTGRVKGSFKHITGDIVVSEQTGQSKVSASAPVEEFTTGNPRRDAKVKSAQLLNAAEHPHLTFSSTDIQETPDGWVLRGKLTVIGGTAPLELLITELTAHPGGMGIKATGKVDRYAHGLTAMKGMVGRWLTLEVDAHAMRPESD